MTIQGKKCGGVLITATATQVKIGIGINIQWRPDHLDQETTCMSLHTDIDRDTLLERIADKLSSNGMTQEQVIAKWSAMADWRPNKYGKPIKLTTGGHLVVQGDLGEVYVVKNIL